MVTLQTAHLTKSDTDTGQVTQACDFPEVTFSTAMSCFGLFSVNRYHLQPSGLYPLASSHSCYPIIFMSVHPHDVIHATIKPIYNWAIIFLWSQM